MIVAEAAEEAGDENAAGKAAEELGGDGDAAVVHPFDKNYRQDDNAVTGLQLI